MYSTVISVSFLVVSLVSLFVQSMSLSRIIRLPAGSAAAWGLLRTVICRVAVASAYVAMGIAVLITPPDTGVIALAVFTAVQLVWWANSAADVRLRHRMDLR
jgi:hypothetical protein